MTNTAANTQDAVASTLLEIIEKARHWVVGEDPDSGRKILCAGENSIPVPFDDFYSLDVRFETLFDILLQKQPSISGSTLRLALLGWTEDFLELPIQFIASHYKESDQPETFQVRTIYLDPRCDLDKQLLELSCSFLVPKKLNPHVSFAHACVRSHMYLPTFWLNQHCPGWQERWSMASTLELDAALVPRFVFGKMPLAPIPSLPSTDLSNTP